MKKLSIFLVVLLTVLMVFVGCGKKAAAEVTEKGITIHEGKLTVGTSPDYAPYEFYTLVNGQPTLAGFDLALAQYIADYMNLELEVIPMDFDGIIMEVQNGGVDLGISGFSPSPDREEVVNFSQIYYDGKQSFVCLKKNADKFNSLEKTNNSSVSVGAQIGSIQMELAEQNSPNASLIALTKVTDLIAEVLSGKIDGAYVEQAVAESYAKNYPDLCVALDVPYESEGNVVLVPKDNPQLLEAVKSAVAAALSDGSMGKFVEEANSLDEYIPE